MSKCDGVKIYTRSRLDLNCGIRLGILFSHKRTAPDLQQELVWGADWGQKHETIYKYIQALDEMLYRHTAQNQLASYNGNSCRYTPKESDYLSHKSLLRRHGIAMKSINKLEQQLWNLRWPCNEARQCKLKQLCEACTRPRTSFDDYIA